MWQTVGPYVGLQIGRKKLLSLEVGNFYRNYSRRKRKNLSPNQPSNNILGGVTTVNSTTNVCLINYVLL